MSKRSISTALLCGCFLALAGAARSEEPLAAPELNGTSLNGESLNGVSLNGKSLNGTSLNKLAANKLGANKLAANKLGLNGASLNGDYGAAETPLVRVRSVTLAAGASLGVTR